jgi:hypothetical protein
MTLEAKGLQQSLRPFFDAYFLRFEALIKYLELMAVEVYVAELLPVVTSTV